MSTNIIAYLSSLVSLLVIDAVWLTVMVKRFYVPNLGGIMSSSPKLLPAAIFYLLYTVGVVFFIIKPALIGDFGLLKVFAYGAFFGLIAYSTYDLTNHATIDNWPVVVTVVDMAWGAFVTGTVSLIAVYVTRYFS